MRMGGVERGAVTTYAIQPSLTVQYTGQTRFLEPIPQSTSQTTGALT